MLGLAAVSMLAVGVVAACVAPEAPPPIPTVSASPPVRPAAPPLVGGPTNPLLDATDAPSPAPFFAVVAERIAAGNYSYLRLTLADGDERWLATMGGGQQPGTRVRARAFGLRQRFHSRRTGRTFDRLYFGDVEPAS